MDIQVYEDILSGLKQYNEDIGAPYGNTVVRAVTEKSTYPLSVLTEVTNLADADFHGRFDKVALLGYRLEVNAKEKNKTPKDKVARLIAKELNDYLTEVVGLTQMGYNIVPMVNDNSICRVIITYSVSLHENRQRFF